MKQYNFKKQLLLLLFLPVYIKADTIRLGVYAVITNQNNEILLTKTQSGSKVIYNFPGGGIDSGESFAQALKRECLEELGINITISKRIFSSQNLYPHKDFPYSRMFNLYYLVQTDELANALADDCIDIAWVSLDNLPLDEMLDVDKEFVKFYQSEIQV
ncbi:MAG: NUDIX hydrolase [Candidatus Dependentiae bacterium]